MGIMRTVATLALGYAAARGVDRLRKGPAPSRASANAEKGEAWMKARADRFRDKYTSPRTGPRTGPSTGPHNGSGPTHPNGA